MKNPTDPYNERRLKIAELDVAKTNGYAPICR